MVYLLLVSLIWAFSFGLIRVSFESMDPVLLALLRMGLAMLLFLPFARQAGLGISPRFRLMAIGAIQYGMMYGLLFTAFQFIGPRSYLIALFTLTTPILVLLFAAIMEGKPHWQGWMAAVLAVIGAAVIQWKSGLGQGYWTAFWLLQGSNAAFAFGQIAYRRVEQRIRLSSPQLHDRHFYVWVFAGAVLFTGLWTSWGGKWQAVDQLNPSQWGALLYLGLVASGLCFFWWNRGATQVSSTTLAVMNNLKVPLAVVVSLLVFQEWREVAWGQFLAGSGLMVLAFWLSQQKLPAPRT